MIEKMAVAAAVLLTAIIYGAFITTGQISQPEMIPPTEEPSIPMPPKVATTTEEAQPEPKEKEPEAELPPGVICMEDCPLIDPEVVEEIVYMHFADAPIMVDIAKCESRFRQYEKDGTVLKNREGSSATGVFQIMASVHRKNAANLGYDINTLEGNIGYAQYLYELNGTRDWEASRLCWGSADMAMNNVISET